MSGLNEMMSEGVSGAPGLVAEEDVQLDDVEKQNSRPRFNLDDPLMTRQLSYSFASKVTDDTGVPLDDNHESDFDPIIHPDFQYHVLRKVMWDDSNHFKVLTQSYGSVWPHVFPLCVLNMLWTLAIWALKRVYRIDITVSASGHKYAAALMSFLLVTRLQILFGRYMENSKNLTQMLKACKDLTANLCILTARDTSKTAKRWRQDVTYSLLILLRVSVAVLQFRSNEEENPWQLPEFLQEFGEDRDLYSYDKSAPKDAIHTKRARASGKKPSPKSMDPLLQVDAKDIDMSMQSPSTSSSSNATATKTNKKFSWDKSVEDPAPPRRAAKGHRRTGSTADRMEDPFSAPSMKKRLAHICDEERKEMEEVARAPKVLALNVRLQLMRQRDGTVLSIPRDQVFDHPCNEETRLLDFVGDFIKCFENLYKNMTTPIPFPLVQMTKTFLHIWIFTVPLAIVHEKYSELAIPFPIIKMVLVFIITFGFLGVDFVSMELTDNFGLDPSDFDALGMSQIAMEDCYMAIYECDGKEWAHALRKRFRPKKEDKSGLFE